jgi:aspartate aminotransferase|tara:strand:+ start:4240 stop:5475 length:1236 start_codon:yes stop_codon:yes gene_type:complete
MKTFIKQNIESLKTSATLAINEKTKELKSAGRKIYSFGFGQSPFPVPDKVVSELKKNAEKKDYLPVMGLNKLRAAISEKIKKDTGIEYPKENILITPGSKEGMFLMHLAFKGEIILPIPSWVSYEPQAKIAKNKVHWIHTDRENNWFPTAKELEKTIKKISKKNIILILNSPNNPSGSKCKNFKELANVIKKYKIIVLSDEIYTDITFDSKYESISKYCPNNTIITGGLSKWCGAGGWRLGFFAVPKKHSKFLKTIKSLASETFSSVNTPVQHASVEAYTGNYEEYKNITTNILKAVGKYVYDNLKSNKILINPPQGGFYLLPEFINKKYKTSSDMCDAILEETGVALLPGSEFGFSPKKMIVRLSYTDFNGGEFFENCKDDILIDDKIIAKFAPNVVAGVKKLSIWAKNL